MQNLKIQEEIKALKGLGQHLEEQLKLASVELGDFADEDLALLDKCADYYALSHIHDFNLNFMRDFYCAKKRDCIENRQIKVQQRIELQRIKSATEEATRDVAILERFMSTAEERLIPDSVVLQRNSQHLATKQALLDRQKTLKIPKDFNIESVIEKVDSLEQR
ncbi:augmin complex subunit wac [Drosophila subpulchrella]|uniref:augmin complex subunit wac n=1 Tax=Drosophila subpulchrella TaxID=1486046 RepID=UPI0018A15E8B|nr:augmin complex subunit wac [Drosophila subpulchrella]